MKKTIILLFICCALQAFAHNLSYEHLSLKQWNIEKEHRVVSGSFYILKNNEVYIEDARNKVLHFSLHSLSISDQKYVLQKQERVVELNRKIEALPVSSAGASSGKEKFLLLFIVLALLGTSIYIFADSKKFKYLLPMFLVGVITTLYSFTAKIMKIAGTTTDPIYIDSAFVPFKPIVYTRWDQTYFYIESKGIPTTHDMMVGISDSGWQQQFPIPQCYTGSNAWSIPLNPTISSNPIAVDNIHFTRGAIAIAVNGIPIFNVHTNTGVDSYTDGQLDTYGGHCGRADDYHYHIAPLHLYNYTLPTVPIAFGLDGFAVYGIKEPDGSNMLALDGNHGHIFNGVYHYHGTTSAPYMIGKMVGVVNEDATHQIIPQAAASPIRPAGKPLKGALIKKCKPNASNNGYTLTYTLNGNTDSVEYSWNTSGSYTFNFYTPSGKTTSNYNGFKQCKVPVGMKDISFVDNSIVLYPNPSTNLLYIQLGNHVSEKEIQGICIYDLDGQLVYNVSSYRNTIDTRNLAKGLYLVKIQLSTSQVYKKLIVQ